MKETFENFLGRVHIEDEPTVLDDDIQEAYEAWLENLGIDLLIAYAEKWHIEQMLSALQK